MIRLVSDWISQCSLTDCCGEVGVNLAERHGGETGGLQTA